MIIVMQKHAAADAVAQVVALIRSHGLSEHISEGAERTIIGAVGDERVLDASVFERLPQVERAMRILHDWRIISREACVEDSVFTVRGIQFGAQRLRILPMPQLTDRLPEHADAWFLDPFFVPPQPYEHQKPTSDSQMIRRMQAQIALAHAAQQPVLLRLRDVRQLDAALDAQADVLYLGGELMGNRTLQNEVGRLNTPVVLTKDKHHTVDDWLLAAEHIALQGNHQIILGEAGTLSLSKTQTFRLDVDAVAAVRQLSHLPVLVNVLNLSAPLISETILIRLAYAAGAQMVVGSASGFQVA